MLLCRVYAKHKAAKKDAAKYWQDRILTACLAAWGRLAAQQAHARTVQHTAAMHWSDRTLSAAFAGWQHSARSASRIPPLQKGGFVLMLYKCGQSLGPLISFCTSAKDCLWPVITYKSIEAPLKPTHAC